MLCNILNISKFKHYKVNHSKLFIKKKNHINSIENFWNQIKRHTKKFNGIPKQCFHLSLKECEWRFNRNTTSGLEKVIERELLGINP